MFTNNFDPIAFQIFSLEIRWYSLAYITGILLGWLYCKKKIIKDRNLLNLFDDFITYLIIGIILGGRLGYILLYDFSYYLDNFFDIFAVWNGGMSFHGGLTGVIVATLLFSKKHKINYFIFLDLVSLVAPIGIFLGRIANFINSELYGTETNVPWAVKFIKIDNVLRHPSQLYEAFLEGFVLFLILIFFVKRGFLKNSGLISGIFLTLYSIFRFVIEFFRVPDDHLGYLFLGLTMGQMISLIFLTAGLYLILKKYEYQKK